MSGTMLHQARKLFGAAAFAGLSAIAAPAWGQQLKGCYAAKGNDDGSPMSLELAIISDARAAKPQDFASFQAKLQIAKDNCLAKANGKGGKSVTVHKCVADSSALLARITRSPNDFRDAECGYSYVLDRKPAPAVRSDALEGRAGNYLEWGGRSNEALRDLTDAVAEPGGETFKRRLAIARIYRDQTNPAKATESYGKLGLLSHEPGYAYSTDERAALQEWVAFKRDKPTEAKPLWERLDTAEANLELGKLAFAEPNSAGAEARFLRAKTLAGDQAGIATSSNYYLAVLKARDKRWSEARGFANLAVVGGPAYKRMACLTFVAEGSQAALSQPTSSPICTPSDPPSAEDYVARGAYLFRQMQFVPKCDDKPVTVRASCDETRRLRVVALANEAYRAFREGQPLVKPSDPPGFDWLLLGGPSPSVINLLRTGESLANSVTQNGYGCLKLVLPAPGTSEYVFFEQLDLLSCDYKRFVP